VTPGIPCDDSDWCTLDDICVCHGGTGLVENFDSVTPPALPTNWTSVIIVSPTLDWTTVTTAADTAPNSAWGEDVGNLSDKALVTPVFTGGVGSQLTFAMQRGFEGSSAPYCFDGGVPEIKIGAGAWEDIIAAGGSFVTGGYNGTIYSGYSNPLAGRAGWCYSGTAFEAVSVNMPPASTGQPTQLRWRIATDSSVGATGWWIDTIVLPLCEIQCVGTPRICEPPDDCHFAKCDKFASECVVGTQPDGTTCVDANPCTTPDQCVNGVCTGGPPVPPPPDVNSSVSSSAEAAPSFPGPTRRDLSTCIVAPGRPVGPTTTPASNRTPRGRAPT